MIVIFCKRSDNEGCTDVPELLLGGDAFEVDHVLAAAEWCVEEDGLEGVAHVKVADGPQVQRHCSCVWLLGFLCVCLCVGLSVCLCVFLCVCLCVFLCVSLCVCLCACLCIFLCICLCVRLCILCVIETHVCD